MDGESILAQLSNVTLTGGSLSTEEASAVACSLPLLKKQTKSKGVLFWGKILGSKKDILLAKTYGRDYQKDTKNYYSLDGVTWGQLPEVTPEIAKRASRLNSLFVGDLGFEYKLAEVAPPEEKKEAPAEGEEGEEAAEAEEPAEEEAAEGGEVTEPFDEDADDTDVVKDAPATKYISVVLREEERVAAVMASIDRDTGVVPRGSLMLSASHIATPNPSFNGLDHSGSWNAHNLSSYMHSRTAESYFKKTLLQREGLSQSLDFLDPLTEDEPKGAWSNQYDGVTGTVSLRSLMWPGHCFFHKVQTPNYGSCYIGTGQKNTDLCFML